jgi:hypothetical protein
MRYPDGSIKRVLNTKIWYPEKEFLSRYFQIANAEKEKLQHDLKGEADAISKRQNKTGFNPDKFVDEIVANKEKFLKKYCGREFINQNTVQREFNTSVVQAKMIKSLAERKLGMA